MVLLHGGPGAAGGMRPVARQLADSFRLLEPLQRGSGGEPLSVARHIADLDEVLASHCKDERPALVGSSWGAMLALAYAAAYPNRAGSLVLIGCGTFDTAARARLQTTLEERIDRALRQRLDRLPVEQPDPNERLRVLGDLLLPVYSYDPITTNQEVERCDAHAHQQTWDDMLRLQQQGVYPAAFAAIKTPVLMLHGAVDPHPGKMIRASLAPYLPQLEYREWEHCGHYPWLERTVRDEFFTVLGGWLARPPCSRPARPSGG